MLSVNRYPQQQAQYYCILYGPFHIFYNLWCICGEVNGFSRYKKLVTSHINQLCLLKFAICIEPLHFSLIKHKMKNVNWKYTEGGGIWFRWTDEQMVCHVDVLDSHIYIFAACSSNQMCDAL